MLLVVKGANIFQYIATYHKILIEKTVDNWVGETGGHSQPMSSVEKSKEDGFLSFCLKS